MHWRIIIYCFFSFYSELFKNALDTQYFTNWKVWYIFVIYIEHIDIEWNSFTENWIRERLKKIGEKWFGPYTCLFPKKLLFLSMSKKGRLVLTISGRHLSTFFEDFFFTPFFSEPFPKKRLQVMNSKSELSQLEHW